MPSPVRLIVNPSAGGGKAGRVAPVLILTARGQWDERVEGIEAGADDYVVKPFRVEEVIARANDDPHGLGGSVWSKDIQKAKDIALQLQCGTAWINKHGPIQPNAPFGGVKSSGFGVEFGEEGLLENTDVQVVWS